jgi:hypothetical protein
MGQDPVAPGGVTLSPYAGLICVIRDGASDGSPAAFSRHDAQHDTHR